MHEPVLLKEVIEGLHIYNQARYIDATVGAGGHSREIIKNGGIVLGLDADESMLEIARKNLEEACPAVKSNNFDSCFKLVQSNFIYIARVAREQQFVPVSGILFDLGVSNYHFLSEDRGFSFLYPHAQLDMRLNSQQQILASDLLNVLNETQLKVLFMQTMDPLNSSRLVSRILRLRVQKKFETVSDFLEACSFLRKKTKTHPATKAFLALRMAVNSEMQNISDALPDAINLLSPQGRLAVITFHSLEDAEVKRIFMVFEKNNLGKIITKKPISASISELDRNPKARSAKLRIFERL